MKSMVVVVSFFYILVNKIMMTEYGITRNQQEKRALFRKIVQNRVLKNTPIAYHENCKATCCARQCLSNLICQSFYVNNDLKNCYLLDVDRNSKSYNDTFVRKDGYAYYDTGFTLTHEAWRHKPLYNIICNKSCGGCPCIHKEEEGDVCDCYYGNGRISTGNLCWKPRDGCGSSDGTNIILDVCDDDPVYNFKYNAETGDLIHVCSNKRVCSMNGVLGNNGQPVVLGTCPDDSTLNKWLLLFGMYLYYGIQCIHPHNAIVSSGNTLVLHYGCGGEITLHKLQYQVPGRVLSEIWYNVNSLSGLTGSSKFPNSPDRISWHHNLDIPNWYQSLNGFGRRLRTRFTSPETGNYTFFMTCDDACELFVGDDESSKTSIILQQLYTARYDYQSSSAPQHLQSGQMYFMEVLFVDVRDGDHVAVGVKFPSGKEAFPITERYLTVP